MNRRFAFLSTMPPFKVWYSEYLMMFNLFPSYYGFVSHILSPHLSLYIYIALSLSLSSFYSFSFSRWLTSKRSGCAQVHVPRGPIPLRRLQSFLAPVSSSSREVMA